jgi:CubicO group peptidase (beta-lactamase class C family)
VSLLVAAARLLSLLLIAVAATSGLASAQGLPTAKPEEVGLSSPRLARATEVVKGEIAKGRYPGAVALVARRGKVVYVEALGRRDPRSGASMTKDAIFRLYSMTKPFAKDPVPGDPVVLLDVTVRQKNDAGGAGAAGTAADYARFSQMLLNGGHLGGTRLLGRATVAQMTADHLGDILVASPILARGYGFGLGFAVRKETGLHWVTGSAGEYRWGGAAGTAFWVDPEEQMVVVWMAQGQPGQRRAEDRDLFRQLVQAALVD